VDWWGYLVIALVVILLLFSVFAVIQRKRRAGHVIAADTTRTKAGRR